MIKIKAFIYRFSNIFGLQIYLANKEEKEYARSLKLDDGFAEKLAIGCWQGKHGFTTIWTYKQPFFTALKNKIKHAFRN